MKILKLLTLASFVVTLSACGDGNDNNSASTTADNATSNMEAMTEEAREKALEEAQRRAEELEALENQ